MAGLVTYGLAPVKAVWTEPSSQPSDSLATSSKPKRTIFFKEFLWHSNNNLEFLLPKPGDGAKAQLRMWGFESSPLSPNLLSRGLGPIVSHCTTQSGNGTVHNCWSFVPKSCEWDSAADT